MIKSMIVEDSRLARLELKQQLKSVAWIDNIAEADNLSDALSLYQQHQPELVFLDIDLPDGTGFDFLASISPAPKVIFTTAFEGFALQAFEQNAVDYLLKPYTQTRLAEACGRLQLEQQAMTNSHSTAEQSTLLNEDSQFFVKDGKKCWLINLRQVERFEAMGNYTRVHFDGKHPMIYRSLSQIEQKLPERAFFRASRQNIVQLKYIENVELCSSGAFELTLASGAQIEISRRQATLFKSLYAL